MRRKFFLLFSLLLSGHFAHAQSEKQSSIEKGKDLYNIHCIACHLENGAGIPGVMPTIIKTKWVLGEKEELIRIMLEGMEGPIRVGNTDYNSIMPPLAYLGDEEIADILTYVRSSFGNEAGPVTPAGVKAVREQQN